jgi:F0F1-type ATP synthase membrane subunit b/b'
VTVKDLSDLVIGLGAVAGALMVIGALLWRVVVKPLRKSLTEELQPVVSRVEKVEQSQKALNTRMDDHIMTHRAVPEHH